VSAFLVYISGHAKADVLLLLHTAGRLGSHRDEGEALVAILLEKEANAAATQYRE
jgi:hypothetical protein